MMIDDIVDEIIIHHIYNSHKKCNVLIIDATMHQLNQLKILIKIRESTRQLYITIIIINII